MFITFKLFDRAWDTFATDIFFFRFGIGSFSAGINLQRDDYNGLYRIIAQFWKYRFCSDLPKRLKKVPGIC